MTTYYQFQPSPLGPFKFQPTLDGNQYVAIVTASFYGQRYYINLYTSNGVLVFCMPVIASEDVNVVDAVSWANGTVEITTSAPHGYQYLLTTNLSFNGFTPSVYNGLFECFVDSQTTVQYPSVDDPGPVTTFGTVSYDVNMAAGYFQTSTLVFRESSQQFEVNP